MKRQDLNERRSCGELGCKLNGEDGDASSPDEVTRYRRIAASANFLAQDRMDIAFASKAATRRMTAPTKDDWKTQVVVALSQRRQNWAKQ